MMIYRGVAMFVLPDADFADDADERRSFIVSNMSSFKLPANLTNIQYPLFQPFFYFVRNLDRF